MGEQSGNSQQWASAILTRYFLPVSWSVLGSCLPDLLHQAAAPGLLTPCYDFSTAGFARQCWSRGRHHTQHKRAADSLLPAYVHAVLFIMCPILISPPTTKSYSQNPALITMSITKQIFPFTLALCISSLHQLLFTASHSTSCKHFPLPPSASFLQEVDAAGLARQYSLSSYSQKLGKSGNRALCLLPISPLVLTAQWEKLGKNADFQPSPFTESLPLM